MSTHPACDEPILTVGHSTRAAADFVALLKAHPIGALVDVRTVPRSRRHPHFSAGALAQLLSARGIDVRHIMSGGSAPRHELTPFAQVFGGQVWSPSPR